MRIVFNANTLQQSESRSITGMVYFDFGSEHRFPAVGWSDCVVVIAGWWLVSLSQLVRTREQTIFRFMDGPYWIAAQPLSPSRLLLRCVEDRRNVGDTYGACVSMANFEREILVFGGAVSRFCEAAGIVSPDLDSLRALLPN